jgi:hypothetical protein
LTEWPVLATITQIINNKINKRDEERDMVSNSSVSYTGIQRWHLHLPFSYCFNDSKDHIDTSVPMKPGSGFLITH